MSGNKTHIRKALTRYSSFLILIALVIALSVLSKGAFFTLNNAGNILRQLAMVGLIAFGCSFCIITGGIDLSGGAICAFAACLIGNLVVASTETGAPKIPILLAIVITVAVCMLFGLMNGLIVGYGNVPAFIATLGVSLVVKGVVQIYTKGFPITGFSKSFNNIGTGHLLGIPIPVIILVLAAAVVYLVMHKTKFGYHVFAVGGNEIAAVVSGVNARKTKLCVYVLASGFAALSGIVLAARTNAALISYGSTYDMDAITCAVIGGVSLAGGRGNLPGIVTGILIVGCITSGMTILQVDAYWQTLIKGVIIIGAVLLDQGIINKEK